VLRCPEAVAFGPSGELYVADQFSHVVQRFSAAGRFLGQWGSFGAGPGQFGAVDGLAVDGAGEVYVLDSSHDRILRFTAEGRLLGEWGSRGKALGEFDFSPGYGPDKPPGGALTVAGRYVYVAETLNNRIVRFRLDGSDPVVWGPPGSAPGRFSSPRGLAVSGGVVYVADEGNHRVQALTLEGRPLYEEGTFGKGPGEFANPFGVAVAGAKVYVVDDNNNRIAVLTRTLRPLGAFDGEGTPYALSYIRAAAVGPDGDLYVAATAAGRIVVFDGSGRPLRAFGVPGTASGQFVAPLGVAVDGAGDVVVAETYGSRSPVWLLDRSHRPRTEIQRGGDAIIGSRWFGPTAAAVGGDGSLWLTDPGNHIVRRLAPSGYFLGALGDPSGVPSSAGGLIDPAGVAVGRAPGAAGEVVYVADPAGHRVVRFTGPFPVSPSPSSAPGVAAGVRTGGERFGSTPLSRPTAVAAAANGDVYVADAGLDRILRFSPAGALLAAWGGPGSGPGRFVEPSGIAVDAAGEVFVVDRAAARIEKFSASGRLLAEWGVSGGGEGELSGPSGIAVDCLGDVLVADTENNRVALFAGAAARGVCEPESRGALGL
jgi:tripartite motif-containing protein 71